MLFDSEIWGPHYWFFLHTIAHSYPIHPNAVTKRKYYDFITNLPLFIPDVEIGNRFANLLDKYPVTPYLDSRESFIRWTHFIHNKINLILGKEEISYLASLDAYKNQYKSKPVTLSERLQMGKKYIHIAVIFILLFLIYVFYS
jgi:Erv1 / Alr family